MKIIPKSVKHIYMNVLQQLKLELKESTKKNAWLILLDTSPWQATNSEECDVDWHNKHFVFLDALPLYF